MVALATSGLSRAYLTIACLVASDSHGRLSESCASANHSSGVAAVGSR